MQTALAESHKEKTAKAGSRLTHAASLRVFLVEVGPLISAGGSWTDVAQVIAILSGRADSYEHGPAYLERVAKDARALELAWAAMTERERDWRASWSRKK